MRTVIFIDLSQIGQIPRDCSFFSFALLGRLVTKEVRELPSAELDRLLFSALLELGSSPFCDEEEVDGKEISSVSSFLGLVEDFVNSFSQ